MDRSGGTKNSTHCVFLRLMPPVIVWGGLEKLMMEWFERIDYSRCRATLVVSTGGGAIYTKYLKEKKLPVDVIEFPFRVNFQYTENFIDRLTKTFRLLSKLRPDQIIFFQGSFVDFDLSHVMAANFAAKGNVYMHENLGPPAPSQKSSKKYLGIIPGLGLWWYSERYLTPWRADFSKQIFTVSSEIKDTIINQWRYTPKKVRVLYHGVDVKRFQSSLESRHRSRSSMGISTDDIVIIVASRLSQEKCVDRTIDAFDELARARPNLRLLIAGTGPYEERLKHLASQKTFKDRIQFLGHVTNVHELYQMSDIYVLSSDNEGLSLAFLEALASGLICFATRCTGITEVINDGVNGFLVEKNTQAVQDGIEKVLKLSDNENQSIRAAAVQHANEHFEINRNLKKAFELLSIPHKNTEHTHSI